MAKVSLRAYNQEIETMIDRGHLDEAIAHCRHILKTFPKHLDTYRLLGKAYLEYKRHPEAADIFARVLVAVPSDFVANVGMSIIRDEENRLDEAIWHMERAFETQPSNAAIQSELQRLYGRREGVQPPRIRMTRGALAHMYVQGELYPQAISEIKGVLKEDPGRSDMQVLLARAYYRSGLKNDAAEAASTVLRSNPHNLDANRVLAEILGTDHPESAQAYRQRVVELDPYAAQVTSSIFTANEVPDAAVSLEHLDWNGQPVGMQPDWQSTQAISLEGAPKQDEQPDWLKNAFGGETPLPSGQPAGVSPFDLAAPPSRPAEPAEDLPDFLRDAGWGKATGAFDESKSSFTESEPVAGEAPIEQGDLPDWVKAMAPQQSAESAEEEEELPDWINKIGTNEIPVSSETAGQPDWLKAMEEPASPPSMDQPGWLDQPASSEPAQASPPSNEEPDWLRGFDAEPAAEAPGAAADLDWLTRMAQGEGTGASAPEAAAGEFDFLNQPAEPFDAAPAAPAADVPGWMADVGAQPGPASMASGDDFDFLDPLGSRRKTTPVEASDEFDFLNELTAESEQPPAQAAVPASSGPLGMSEAEQDDSFAWLESLAAKQGATEGLLTKPEERLDEEPDWVKRAKDAEAVQPPVEQPPLAQPAAAVEELGKSEREQDDSFAWLESLAAKQGATEGLLTKPEERLDEAPEWVQQASSLSERPQETVPVEIPEPEQPVAAAPSASPEDLGTSEQEREDSFAWLEALAAKQGASEGLLTRPEERPTEEPDWVKQARDLGESPVLTPLSEERASRDDTGAWLKSLEEEAPTSQGQMEEPPDWLQPAEESAPEAPTDAAPISRDDTGVWLKSLDEAEAVTPQEQRDWLQPSAEETPSAASMAETPAAADETAAWLRSLDEAEAATAQQRLEETTPSTPIAEMPAAAGDTAAWLKSLDEAEISTPQERLEETAPSAPIAETPVPVDETAGWLQGLEEEKALPGAGAEPASDEIETWLKSLDEPAEAAPEPAETAPSAELPAWMDTLADEKPAEESVPAAEAAEAPEVSGEVSEWMSTIETPEPAAPAPAKVDTGSLPSWLRGLEEEAERSAFGAQDDLPAWLRDGTGEPVAEPTGVEPTRATDWQPIEAEARQPEPELIAPEPAPVEAAVPEKPAPPPQEEPVDVVAILQEKIAAPEPEPQVPARPSRPQREAVARKVTGALTDPVLSQARGEISRNNVSGALENYSRLIKKGRLLEDIIYDLREALYRYPVDVDIWQSLGDAYMRSNRLQDALDAYTKAEELLR